MCTKTEENCGEDEGARYDYENNTITTFINYCYFVSFASFLKLLNKADLE